MPSSLKDALQTALEKARNTPPPPAASAAPAIPSDWDDEGGAKEIKETTTTNEESAMHPAHLFQPTNNVSRETFNYIRDHQGCTRAQLMQALTDRGFNPRSLSALLAQMSKQGMIKGAAKQGLFTAISEYRPIKQRVGASKGRAPRKTRRSKGKVEAPAKSLSEKKAALRGDRADTFAPEWSPRSVLDDLSVIQARAVYDELKKLFGG